jgi:hypothetical protein
MYIKTCNLFNNMTICIHSPCLHTRVNSRSCHEGKKKKRDAFGVRVTHIPGQGARPPFHPVNRVEVQPVTACGFCMWILVVPASLHST